ncbi:MAG: transporter substrate-binding domain-containing protein [Pseudomonadales bacterium]|nr:transporter substrate-binding domain-containing protein [Pseudomonadales bacterium]
MTVKNKDPRRKVLKTIYSMFITLFLSLPAYLYAETAPEVTSCFIDLTFWSDIDGDNKRGIYHDLHQQFFHRLDIKSHKTITASYARLMDMLNKGQCDFSTKLMTTDTKNIRLGSPYWKIRVGVVALKGMPIKQYEDIRALKIGILKEASLGFHFDNDLKLKRIESPRFGQLVDMLANKRIDAIAGDLDVLEAIAKEKSVKLGESFTMQTMELHFVMSNNSKHINKFSLFNKEWQKMVAEGVVKESIVRHFSH